MNVLVTGATGYIGRKLVPLLLDKGFNIRILCRDKEKAHTIFGTMCDLHIGDITDPESIRGCCNNIDTVYQLVGLSGGNEPITQSEFDRFRHINVDGLKNIVLEAEKAGVKRFIQVSSIAAMGIVKDVPISVNSKCNPITPYQVSKREAELYLLDEYHKNNFPVIIARPTFVYGPGGEGSFKSYIKFIKKGFFPKIGTKDVLVSYCYIDDLITNLMLMSEKGKVGSTYILSAEKSISFNKLITLLTDGIKAKISFVPIPKWSMKCIACIVELLSFVCRKQPLITRRNIDAITSDRIYDLTPNVLDLGFTNNFSMEDGIKNVVDSYNNTNIVL